MKGNYSIHKALILCLIGYANIGSAQQSIEWVFDGGPTWFDVSRSTLASTDIETDFLSKGHADTTGELGLSVYYKRSLLLNGSAWFNTLGIGLALRYSGFSDKIATGNVYQFEQANLDNYHYKLYFENTRLLAQLSLDVLTYKQVSLYLMGGIGEGWSRLGYHDVPNVMGLGGGLFLAKENTSRVVGDVGVGFNYHHTTHLAYSLSYLYTAYGHIAASNHGYLNGEPAQVIGPSLSIDSHALLVGIHYLA
ncbi:MAG: hypothetical protein QM652_11520 [Legionella sp.]|uniref:hypothetical protein n=1 Tax=Legionella sp. TaxID=459 RepID=UPI0039E6F1E2